MNTAAVITNETISGQRFGMCEITAPRELGAWRVMMRYLLLLLVRWRERTELFGRDHDGEG